jgi:hypothetical protein
MMMFSKQSQVSLLGIDPPKQDSGLHFNRLTVLLIRFELPLAQGITYRPSLIAESTEKVNVLHLAFFINDDSDRSRIKSMLRE